MGSKRKRTSRVAASVVVIFNFFTMVACAAVFGVSLWIIASPSSLVYMVQVFGNPYLKALITEDALGVEIGIGGAILAGFFIFISLMGLYGAVSGSQFLLFMYATLVLLLLLLECALLFYFASNVVEKGIRNDEHWTHALRLSFQCCDRNFTMPDLSTTPWSCCGVAKTKNCTAENVYKQDCQQTVSKWLTRYQTYIYSTLAAVHLVLFFCAYIRRCLSPTSHEAT